MSDGIIKVMNDMAGETGVQVADIVHEGFDVTASDVLTNRLTLHHPVIMDVLDDMIPEEDMLADVADDPTLPELEDAMDDSGSVAEEDDDDDESETGNYLGDGGEDTLKELYELLEDKAETSESSEEIHQPPLRRSTRTAAGTRKWDDRYDWNLINLSVGAAQKTFGDAATEACKHELLQLFVEKEALIPVRWDSLNEEQ